MSDDQTKAMFQRAAGLVETAEIQAALKKAEIRVRMLVGNGPGEQALAMLPAVLGEWALNYSLKAINSDPNYPELLPYIFSAGCINCGILPNRGFGGDNPDTLYTIAPVDRSGHFALSGTLPAPGVDVSVQVCGDASLSTQLALFSLADFATGDGRTFYLELGPAGSAVGTAALPRDARYLLIRETYSDWQSAPGRYQIERLNPPDAPAMTDSEILQRAVHFIVNEVSTAYVWLAMTGRLPPNFLSPVIPTGDVGGMNTAWISMASLILAPDEAFVLRIPSNQSPYLGGVLMDWWQRSLNPGNSLTSLNLAQLTQNAEGERWIVVSHTDPGVANWLDTGGLEQTKLMVRWQGGAMTQAPEISGDIVKQSALAEMMAGTVDPMASSQRQIQLDQRRADYLTRFG
ncbi:hypothetical protein NCG89_14095 [Spongiibacter taiwanensis]|uniref:hypothetical protein n=1 Tax=Spongiibacter taiwanensis TaxID=1748242 RepID=UPI002034DF2F|nr:hypothetical protein [Spongiibacter taiwanensis]USA42662.1 hypothetical protein NCG89_14095 [Spongiibacter taiwanensis]